MGGETGEERLGAFAAEEMRERRCGRKCNEAEAREQERMGRQHVERSEDFGGEGGPAVNEWLHDAAPALAVGSEGRFGVLQIALERYGGAVIERRGERCGGGKPFQNQGGQGGGVEKKGGRGRGGGGGVGIVGGNGEGVVAREGPA